MRNVTLVDVSQNTTLTMYNYTTSSAFTINYIQGCMIKYKSKIKYAKNTNALNMSSHTQ